MLIQYIRQVKSLEKYTGKSSTPGIRGIESVKTTCAYNDLFLSEFEFDITGDPLIQEQISRKKFRWLAGEMYSIICVEWTKIIVVSV